MENMENMENVQNTEPVSEPTPAPQTEPAPAPQSEPAPAPQPEPAPAPQPEPAPAPQPEPAPAPQPEPAPAPQSEPAPAPEPEPAPAPQSEPAPKKAKKKMKKGAKVLSIILAIVVVLGIAALFILNSPKVVAATSIKRLGKDFLKRDEIATLADAFDGGSLEFALSEITNEDGENLLESMSFAGKLYLSNEAFAIEDLKAEIGDFKINGDLYLSLEEIYVSEDHLLGGSYGAKFEDIGDDFRDSIFAYGSGSDYEIPDEEISDTIAETLDTLSVANKYRKDFEKTLNKVIDDAYRIFAKHAEFESENDDGSRVITITVDEKALAKIVEDLAEYLEKDDTIRDFLDEYDEYLTTLYNANARISETDELDSFLDIYEEFVEEFSEEAEDMADDIKEQDFKVSVKIATPMLSNKMRSLTVKVDKEELFSVDFGKKGVKNTDEIKLDVNGENVMTYKVKENNGKEFSSKLEINDEEVFSAKIDKKDKEFKLEVDIDGKGTTLEGSYDVKKNIFKGKTTTIEFEKVTVKFETYEEYYDEHMGYWTGDYVTKEQEIDLDLVITLKGKDKMPEPEDYDTIADIKDSDIEKWVENFENSGFSGFGKEDSGEPERLQGYYKSSYGDEFYFYGYNSTDGDFTLYDIYGDPVMNGSYSISGSEIYFDYYDYSYGGYTNSWHSFSQGADYVIVDGTYYYQQ